MISMSLAVEKSKAQQEDEDDATPEDESTVVFGCFDAGVSRIICLFSCSVSRIICLRSIEGCSDDCSEETGGGISVIPTSFNISITVEALMHVYPLTHE